MLNWFKKLFKKPEPEVKPEPTAEQVNRLILTHLHNMRGDILCIMDKQIELQGLPLEKFTGSVIKKNFVLINSGEHEWVCKDCGFPIHDCREAQSQSLN